MPLSRTRSVLLVSAVLGCGGGGGDDGGTTGPGPGPNNQTLGSIVLSTPSLTLTAGNMAAITVVAYDTENAIIANAGSPTFTSANPAVAEVDNQGNVLAVAAGQGNVLAVAAGSTQITASLTRGSVTKSASAAVSVTGSLPSSAAVEAGTAAYFQPGTVIIQRGGSVTWNFGSLEHSVSFSPANGVPSNIAPTYGSSVDRTFHSAGNFNYTCTIHAGMTGLVMVR